MNHWLIYFYVQLLPPPPPQTLQPAHQAQQVPLLQLAPPAQLPQVPLFNLAYNLIFIASWQMYLK